MDRSRRSLAPAPRGGPGMSVELAALPAWLDDRAARGEFSGVVLLRRDGETVFEHAAGLASRAHGVPNSMTTRFAVASVAKWPLAVTVLRLVERGELDLHAPLADLLPGRAGADGGDARAHPPPHPVDVVGPRELRRRGRRDVGAVRGRDRLAAGPRPSARRPRAGDARPAREPAAGRRVRVLRHELRARRARAGGGHRARVVVGPRGRGAAAGRDGRHRGRGDRPRPGTAGDGLPRRRRAGRPAADERVQH